MARKPGQIAGCELCERIFNRQDILPICDVCEEYLRAHGWYQLNDIAHGMKICTSIDQCEYKTYPHGLCSQCDCLDNKQRQATVKDLLLPGG